jgi:signal transduction histidine kinase/DNA-binding response OmpR family regulator/ligand-binding sensor domain-containing protein
VAESQYRFRNFETKDGLPAAWVRSIAQDRLGFIWMQSVLTLTRFDGYTFKVYRHDPSDTLRSLPTGGVGYILTDPRGNLWVTAHSTTAKGFPMAKYDEDTDGFIRYKPAVDGSIVIQYVFDKSDPVIWFTTNGKGLFSFNTETLKTTNYVNGQPDSLTRARSNSLWGIIDLDSCVLIGSREGLWLFDKKKMEFKRPKCNAADSADFYHTPIWDIIEVKTQEFKTVLWSNRKAFLVDENLSVVKRFDFPSWFRPSGYDIDAEGVFWFHTFDKDGLHRYDPKNDALISIRNNPEDMNSLISNSVNQVKVDRDQNIWITTDRGVSLLQRQKLRFNNFTIPGMGESSIYHQNEKDFLIITKTRNINVNNAPAQQKAHDILIAHIAPARLDSLHFEKITDVEGIVVSGLWQGRRSFWVNVYGKGVARLPIDPMSGMIIPGQHKLLSHDSENSNTISSNFTTFVWENKDENLWVGNRFNGVDKINLGLPYGSKASVLHYGHDENDSTTLSNDIVWNTCPDDNNALWITTDTGLDLFKGDKFEHFFKGRNSPMVYKASDGTVFAAAAGGLYEGKASDGNYEFIHQPLVRIEDVVRIYGDDLDRLWLSTMRGLVCYDPEQKITIEFNEKDGFEHTHDIQPYYKRHLTSTGIMAISDRRGISLFDPSSLEINKEKTFPLLTSLKVNNLSVDIQKSENSSQQFSIKKNISVLDELILDYQHNNFALEFAAMEMTSPDKNLYRHKLEGYDKDWIETDWKDRVATYTNLDPGTYTFKVKASNHHGIWSDQEATLRVVILPPPWKTWWAYSAYGLTLIGIVFLWRRYDLKRVKLKHRAEHLSELDNLKTRFFTNISHEFRTPITLIQGPLKEMYDKALNKEERSTVGIMLRNAQRLSKLINQLLDLSKLEAGKMALHASKVELVQFLREIAASYESLAANKNIKYFFYPEVAELMVYIDVEKMEKVVHNLLSNAFKFTKENGEVILYLKAEESHCNIIVKDTGIGIPSDQLNKVFDRFHQVDSSQTRSYEGSGLGMALAKELVELHHGMIRVESTEGKGTTFTVTLRLGKDHLNTHEIIEREDRRKSDPSIEETFMSPEQTDAKTAESTEVPILLIAEDNADMRQYICKIFSDQYQIHEATNGKEGLQKANDSIPDLIISDVMMPEMDGYKFCESIKTNEQTSHIPVILLTAKADRDSRIAGLETGADDYLAKPFDAEELKVIVRKRIEERRKIRERFSKEITLEPKQIAITSFDEKFLKKVMAVIEDHMSDESFSIDDLSREAGYSNMHFYRKIKALAGETPSQFLRTIRLKRAAELLRAKSDNVTQIAYSVGFNSLSYFNKCFKEQFGVTPGHYVAESTRSKV